MAKQEKKRSRDGSAPNIEYLEDERRELTVNKTDPERLEKVKSILDYFNFGIITKGK